MIALTLDDTTSFTSLGLGVYLSTCTFVEVCCFAEVRTAQYCADNFDQLQVCNSQQHCRGAVPYLVSEVLCSVANKGNSRSCVHASQSSALCNLYTFWLKIHTAK